MGAFKGDDARYEIVCTRLTAAQLKQVQDYASARNNMGISTAVRMLLMIGLEFVERNNA